MQIENISDTIHRLILEDQEIILLGTAHISQNSVEEAERLIDEENPDRVCIELDDGRMKSHTEKKSWDNMDIRKVIKEGRGFFLLANTALASFQRRMGAQTGTNPGDEILGAAKLAKEKDIPVSLCDRDIQLTFKRAWAKSGLWNKCKLLATLISAAFSKEEITAEELEELKKQDTVQSMMNEMAKELPTVKEVLIDERDQYLGRAIWQAPGKKKLAVIGAGHTNGVISTIGKLSEGQETPTLEALSEIPKGSKVGKLASYIIPTLIVLLLVLGVVLNGWDQGVRLFLYWIAVNCTCTFIGTTAALAHPLNILACTVTAPFFALNPVLGVGMLGGVLEATFRKPKVKDYEKINDDALKFSSWYKNRILHPLLVLLFSSLGSAFGTLVAFPLLISHL